VGFSAPSPAIYIPLHPPTLRADFPVSVLNKVRARKNCSEIQQNSPSHYKWRKWGECFCVGLQISGLSENKNAQNVCVPSTAWRNIQKVQKTFTPMPNEYDELVSGAKLSGRLQHCLIWCILRHSSPVDNGWATISLDTLSVICGGPDRQVVSRSLIDLVKRGIIESSSPHSSSTKSYKLRPENWATAPPHTPLRKAS
jgi:hypothetical protein